MLDKAIRLLLVEDNPGDARLIEEILRESGTVKFRLDWVASMSAALEHAAREETDLILLDLSLPDSSGLETFQRMHAAAGDLPIIALTGLDDEELAITTVQSGAQDYLVKGHVDAHLLVRAIRYGLERKEAQLKLSRYAEDLRSKNAAIEAEQQMAREIQHAFLPTDYPTFPRGAPPRESLLRFCHRYMPCTALAGDFFAVLSVSDTQAGVFISDVSGHGVRVALVTTFLRGMLEQLMEVADEPGRFLGEINRSLVGILRPTSVTMFASACYLLLDLGERRIRCGNAGHPAPLLIDGSAGSVAPLHGDDECRGIVLGLDEGFVYDVHECELAESSRILLFTDGVYEALNPAEELFGEERLAASVRRASGWPADRLLDAVLAEVRSFAGPGEFQDDMCLLTVELADGA